MSLQNALRVKFISNKIIYDININNTIMSARSLSSKMASSLGSSKGSSVMDMVLMGAGVAVIILLLVYIYNRFIHKQPAKNEYYINHEPTSSGLHDSPNLPNCPVCNREENESNPHKCPRCPGCPNYPNCPVCDRKNNGYPIPTL
jgi:hypothetical protein